ncbi:MAG: hypothetical protein LBR16_04640 [Treponema sp.]|jgi:hypothetical protein|nr:hypothetical protein [Treponema sp.]
MNKKLLLAGLLLAAAGTGAFAQVHWWWWGRAQVTPFERSWDPVEADDNPQPDGHLSAYIWWTRFGVDATNGERSVGFQAEVATMMEDTADATSSPFAYWADWADFWSYSLWYKPARFLMVRVGKWNYWPGDAWVLEFFDRTRYSCVGIGEDEFYSGFDNMVQYSTGSVASGTGLSPGALFEGYFGPVQVDLNFKSIDPTMKPLDYLQTLQVGVRYEIPGTGFFRAQMIGFDPSGKIQGNFYKVDNATSQIQAAANITAVPGMEFRVGFHYYLSTSMTNWVDALLSDYNFEADKGAISIPLGIDVTMFSPLSFRVVGDLQFGKDKRFGKDISMFKAGGQVKYMINSYLTGIFNVIATNMGLAVNGAYYEYRKPRIDAALGVQLANFHGAALQAGVVVQIPTAKNTQVGVAIPISFDFGW